MAEGDRDESSTAASGNASPPPAPHYIRITSGGKIKHWVEFALKFFDENPGRPLVLHTLPTHPSSSSKGAADTSGSGVTADLAEVSSSKEAAVAGNQNQNAESESAREKAHQKEATNANANAAIRTSPRNIPRLISVVEIIKREYFKALTPGPDSMGLYQYNYLGFVEGSTDADAAVTPDEDQRQDAIAAALEGKRFLKQEKTPYLKITLCTSALPALESEATCQLPSVKKPSRSAKARRRRRLLREAEKSEKSAQGS